MRSEDIKLICKNVEKLPMEGCYLVTGASGFIGGYIVETLLSLAKAGQKIRVIAPVRNIEKTKRKFEASPCLHIVRWDMDTVLESDETFDYVIHAASPVGAEFFRSYAYDTMKQNLMGCVHLLDLCDRIKPKKVLYVGSASSYGSKIKNGSVKPVEETLVGTFLSMKDTECYAISKLAVEYVMSCAASQMGVRTMAVRLFSVYGPDMSMGNGTVFADLFGQALSSKDLVIHGNGTPIRNFGYITDVIAGIFFVLHGGASGEVYNIGSLTENYSIYEFAKKIAQQHPEELSVVISNFENDNLQPKSVQIPNLEKLLSLGWRSGISLEEGISRMFAYYKIGQEVKECVRE